MFNFIFLKDVSMPNGMDDELWLEREMEEEEARNKQLLEKLLYEEEKKAQHQAKIDEGYTTNLTKLVDGNQNCLSGLR